MSETQPSRSRPGPSPGEGWRGRAELRREVRRQLALPVDDAHLRVRELRRILALLEELDDSIDFQAPPTED